MQGAAHGPRLHEGVVVDRGAHVGRVRPRPHADNVLATRRHLRMDAAQARHHVEERWGGVGQELARQPPADGLTRGGDGCRYRLVGLPNTWRTSSSKCSSGNVSYAGSNATWSHSSANFSASANSSAVSASRCFSRASGSPPKWW